MVLQHCFSLISCLHKKQDFYSTAFITTLPTMLLFQIFDWLRFCFRNKALWYCCHSLDYLMTDILTSIHLCDAFWQIIMACNDVHVLFYSAIEDEAANSNIWPQKRAHWLKHFFLQSTWHMLNRQPFTEGEGSDFWSAVKRLNRVLSHCPSHIWSKFHPPALTVLKDK